MSSYSTIPIILAWEFRGVSVLNKTLFSFFGSRSNFEVFRTFRQKRLSLPSVHTGTEIDLPKRCPCAEFKDNYSLN